jgi:acetone carboxylase gamma subunit
MKYKARIQNYNQDKLIDELRVIDGYQSITIEGNVLYINVSDNANVQLFKTALTNHDPSLTDEQSAEIAIDALRNSTVTSRKVMPIVNAFDNAWQARRGLVAPDATSKERLTELESRYTVWRTIFDAQPNLFKGLVYDFWLGTVPPNLNLFKPPDPVTPEYMLAFNNAIKDTTQYIAIRIAL